MAKICINPLLLIRKRCYGVMAENGRRVAAAAIGDGTVVKKAAGEPAGRATSAEAAGERKIFWMRDPKTGNWVPENSIEDDINNAVELREKFLSKTNNL